MQVYSFYLKQFTLGQLGPLVAFFAASQLFVFAMDVFLSRWAVGDTSLLIVQTEDPTFMYCFTYAVLGVCTFVFSGTRYVWCQLIGLKASNKMHTQMLNNLVKAPVSFFDVTPIGRIVNRFSGDIANLDISTPVQYHQLIVVTLQLLNSLVVVGVVLPVFFIWLGPMAYCQHTLISKYRVCGRELKRLASNSRSPMFQVSRLASRTYQYLSASSESTVITHTHVGCGALFATTTQHFNETINGLLVVRAFQAVPDFVHKSGRTVNDCSRAEMAQNCSPQWLGIRISLLAACSMFLTSLGIVLQPNRLDAGLVGLLLTYANMGALESQTKQ